nr:MULTISPECIES: hemagglutinin repeat-containing protein [unclassified Microbulbifer]
MASVTDSQTTDYHREEKGSGTFDKDKTVTEQHHSEQVVGSNITAKGGQVTVAADGDVAVLGSGIHAEKDIALSGQDITVAASAYEESHLSAKTESGGFENESLGEASYQLQLAASELNSASGNISLDAAKNITLAAGNLVAGSGDINLTAVDDLLIAAGEVIESTSSWSEDSGYFSGGDFYSSEQQSGATQQTLAQGSQISAGNDINIHAGRAKIIGSDLSAGNDIVAETDIGDLEILAARETTHTTQDEKQVRVSAGDAAQSLADPDDLVKVEDGQLKIKLADAEYHQLDSESTQVSHKGSNLSAGNDIELNAIGDLTIEGSNLAADGDTSGEGDVVLSGENVTIKEAKDSLQTKTSETTGSAEMSVVVQHQAVEVAKAAVALQESADNLKQAKEDYRKYQKDLDNLEDTLDQLEADYANGAPGVTQADIVELKQIIDDAEGDKEWYLAGVAAAAADVTAKTTLLVQQTATAAQSTGTYGFNAGVQLDIDASKTNTESHQTSSLASSLSGSNIRIKTDSGNGGETTGNTLIQGSHLQADNRIAIDTSDLDITASQDTASSRTQTEHGHISVQQTVYGATGGPAVNASMDRSQSRDRQTTYNNSTLNADNISLTTTGDAALTGANVHANRQLDVNIAGDLTAESQQNRASGSNTSAGISGGFGTSGGKDSSLASVNGGANSANGRYQSKETVLTSLTAGGEATVDVGGHTQVTGALIATLDEEGNDLGNLELSTGTLDYADLSNTNYQSQQSAGISTSVGLNGANPADPAQKNAQDATGNDDLKLNTSNVQYSNNSHYSKDKSLATVGQGNITVRDEDSGKNGELAGLNRDVTSTEKELFEVDRQEGNVDVTVDHRLLSEEGRKEIKEDVKRTELLGESIADIATEESVDLQDTFQHIGDVQKDLDVQKLLVTRDGGENASILNDLANATPEQKQQAIDAYAQAYADVYDINIDEAKVVAANTFIGGAHVSEDGTSSSLYINDNAQNNALDYMETMGHEVTHTQIEQGKTRNRGELNEDYADLRGEYAADNYDFSFANNGLGTVDTGLTNNHVGNTSSELIAQNTEQFVSQVESNPGNVEYRPLRRQETEALGAIIDQVQRAPYNQETKDQLIANATAEACAKTHCAEGVPETDPNYQTLKNLQAAGETLIEEGQNLLGNAGDDLFEHDWIDGTQDWLRANGETIARGQGATQAVLGGAATVSSGIATVASAPVCAATGVGCVATAGTAALTALSATATADGYQQATGEYRSSFGQEVLNNLLPETYQDPSNPAADVAIGIGVDVALGTAGKVAGKVVDAAEGLAKSAKKNSKTNSQNSSSNQSNASQGEADDFYSGVDNAGKSKSDTLSDHQRYKDELKKQDLDAIASYDERLADAVKGSGTGNPNFGVGKASASEAEELGKVWVGDGYRVASDGKTLVSADGTRRYRPPTRKPNTPEKYNPTGTQANFEVLSEDGKTIISNAHLVIEE